ncbi:MAG: RdgB/HAM1 family non-canonical purine NTP pyrophosphatase [Synergistaceae bacterium]|nr:RdgB/HAM1 family non-canonical purine NTP pyrophosphatase [Synergistaceae bacterium]
MKVVLASGNRNKHVEFIKLLEGSEIELVPLVEEIEVEENGNSFFSNAWIKAKAWSRKTGLPALADDSGVIVRALNWKPGIRSARIIEGTDSDRNKWLLAELKDKADRYAEYVSAIALCDCKSGWTIETEGRCPGVIDKCERGNLGFGYDPLFIPNGYSGTFGELSAEVKLKISHRSIALYKLLYVVFHSSVIKS